MTTIIMLPAPRPAVDRAERPAGGPSRGGDDFASTLDAASRSVEGRDREAADRATGAGRPADRPAEPRADGSGRRADAAADGAATADVDGEGEQPVAGRLTVAQIVHASVALLESVGGATRPTPPSEAPATDAPADGDAPDEGPDATVLDLTPRLAERAAAAEAAAAAPQTAEDADGADRTRPGTTTPGAVATATAQVPLAGDAEGSAGEGGRRGTQAQTPIAASATSTGAAADGVPVAAAQASTAAAAAPAQPVVQPMATGAEAGTTGVAATVTSPSGQSVEAAPAPAPTGATPGAEPRALADQLGVRLSALRTAPLGEHVLTLRVDPESMGPVRVVARIGTEGVRIELIGGTEHAREALRAAMPDLRRDLVAAGLTADLELGTEDPAAGGQDADTEGGAGTSPGALAARTGTTDEPTPDPTDPRPVDRLLGRLDLLV